MIVVTRSDSGITVEGHAGYAPRGQDIVCAGVSTLVQTLVESLEAFCADAISYSLKPGMVEIKFRDLSADADLLISSFFVGICMIAERYPDHVKVNKHTGAGVEPPDKKATENTEKQNS